MVEPIATTEQAWETLQKFTGERAVLSLKNFGLTIKPFEESMGSILGNGNKAAERYSADMAEVRAVYVPRRKELIFRPGRCWAPTIVHEAGHAASQYSGLMASWDDINDEERKLSGVEEEGKDYMAAMARPSTIAYDFTAGIPEAALLSKQLGGSFSMLMFEDQFASPYSARNTTEMLAEGFRLFTNCAIDKDTFDAMYASRPNDGAPSAECEKCGKVHHNTATYHIEEGNTELTLLQKSPAVHLLAYRMFYALENGKGAEPSIMDVKARLTPLLAQMESVEVGRVLKEIMTYNQLLQSTYGTSEYGK